jgi:hypothetical protein
VAADKGMQELRLDDAVAPLGRSPWRPWRAIPFYALPYRLEGGGIRFFSRGYGWYFRDDVVFLKRWLETFARLGACVHENGNPFRLSRAEAVRLGAGVPFYLVELLEADLFYPASNERPFAFVPEAFEKRKLICDEEKRTGKENIAQKVIKIYLAGLSGKVAQSVGGSQTKSPGCYNVFYAGSIRAGTRRSIGEAALQAPHEIVQFCTDAVFSKVPLTLNEGDELGQWELEKVSDLLTVQSGIYSYKDKDGEVENKSRGFMASSVDLDAIESRLEPEGIPEKKHKMIAFREALLTKVPAAWRQPFLNHNEDINEAVTRPNQVWAMDITYIPMARGFVYLAAVVDWFSRKVLAWKLSITLETEFCREAVEEALARYGKPGIFNTDQGSQFTSIAFTGLLLKNEIKISMDGKGAWRDNIFVDRLWHCRRRINSPQKWHLKIPQFS